MKKLVLVISILLMTCLIVHAQTSHPNLLLTEKAVKDIQADKGKYPLFNKTFEEAKSIVDEALSRQIVVPVPEDAGGGYTHEKHKRNYNEMYLAGILFQATGEEKYAEFIRDMLNKYAVLYPTLGRHPQGKIEKAGKLFWQTLNENVWLIHTIQAYDCIYNWLKPEERKLFEDNIFIPMCDFFINECDDEFDLIHNHGTWMVASVGMTGLVIDRNDYVEKALHGTGLDNKGGFLAQLDNLFSPDGYYTEGGYYARYAIWPFYIFSEALENNRPDLDIFGYRESILKKALYSTLQMTYSNGAFMPINDALKEKTWITQGLVLASNVAFERYGHDKSLLFLVKQQDEVTLNAAGLVTAKALSETSDIPAFEWKSINFSDGPDGQKGGVSILRWGEQKDMQTLLFKYSSHGLSHGHFDKLHFLFYDQGQEIIQDYGAARFLNVVQKFGGRYLKENDTYAKQTVAHNTVVVDETSDFNGDLNVAEEYHPEGYLFDTDNENFQYVSAKDNYAYPGVEMHRTMALINDGKISRPIILDVFRIVSDKEHQYDLPFYYLGQIIYTNFEYTSYDKEKTTMGKADGYQHLWKNAYGEAKGSAVITWLNNKRFYSLVTSAGSDMGIYFTEIGAGDPKFNLRNDPGLMLRKNAKDFVFASVIEPHGEYNPAQEYTTESYSSIKEVNVIFSSADYTIVNMKGDRDIDWLVMISNSDNDQTHSHSVDVKGKIYSWTGAVFIQK